MTDWATENWLSDAEISRIEYSQFWNDEEMEKDKAWYILDGDFAKMERYLETTSLALDLSDCVKVLNTDFKRHLTGVGIDMAAGNLWAVPRLLRLGTVDKIYCLEYSKHRLLQIGPAVLEYYGVPKERVVLALGSFYDLHLKNKSLDFVFMSQAFHHADDPNRLLREVDRVLRDNGVIIIVGEHVFGYRKEQAKHIVKYLISRLVPKGIQQRLFGRVFAVRTLMPSRRHILPPDPVIGDHYYTPKEYESLFSGLGFQAKRLRRKNSSFQSFVLMRPTGTAVSGTPGAGPNVQE
jgi:SAM-dependent methyltransferase